MTHTTNYTNTFIEIAEDCPVERAEIPPKKNGKETVANLQFDLVFDHPYKYTSDDVIFTAFALRNKIPNTEWKEARALFFAKGQACMRSSPLTKRYGWGVHSDAKSKIAIYPRESAEYKKLLKSKDIERVKAMRSKKAT